MTHTRRRALLSAATILGVGLTSLALALPASADVDADFVQSSNASDPSAFPCKNPSGTQSGYCLVTSTDAGLPPFAPGTLGENYYPMDVSQVFYSSNGLSWTRVGTQQESALGVAQGTRHLWAPNVRPLFAGSNGTRPTSNYYMYTPDIINSADRYSSRIWLTYSSTVGASFGTSAIYGHPSSAKKQQLLGIPTAADIATFQDRYPLYMSDPSVFTNTTDSDWTYQSHENDDYMLWADGDWKSCGGLSIRKMTNHWTVQQFHNPNEAWLDIQGLNSGTDALGGCTKVYPMEQTLDRPYIEGGELYHKSRFAQAATPNEGMPGPYFVVFAAKPDHVPARCAGGGEPGTANEVIGYATSDTVDGTYTYQGIIMCGSSTEWTNQATIEQVKASDGTSRLVLVYHDGANTGPNGDVRTRSLHSECLYAVDGKFVKTMRSGDGAASVSGSPSWCMQKSQITALTSASNGKYVSVNASGGLAAVSQDVGIWEQLSRTTTGGYTYFKARNGDKYVATSTAQLTANLTSTSLPARFTLQNVAGTKYRIIDAIGRYVQTQPDGTLKVNSKTPSSDDNTYDFWLQTLTN